MNKEQIKQAVQNYIKNDNAQYALLINGAWGSGKTFLYEKYLMDTISSLEVGKNKRKTNIYISLYGMSSIEELSKQLLSSYLFYTKANGNEVVKKGAKAVAGILGAASRALSFSIGAVSADLEVLNEIKGAIEAKDLVICFDDLERCSISISEVFGYINNLVEHCNCKVIILADENNIGKTYANINLEQKYQTILTGGRKVVRNNPADEDRRTSVETDELTIKELKQLNEALYSENYIYRDIKEKVIGKICNYTPEIEESLKELILGNEKYKGYLEESRYRRFLVDHIDKIVEAFKETDNKNLRVAVMWMDLFEDIYKITCKNFNGSEDYESIIEEFLRYSIWAVVAERNNKQLIRSLYYGENSKYVYFEGHEYNHVAEYLFINKYMQNACLNEAELVKAARDIEERCRHNKKVLKSEGKAYLELYDWRFMEDAEVKDHIQQMLEELEQNKYVYEDYAGILTLLIVFRKYGLYEENIAIVQEKMISLIENDRLVQEEGRKPLSFSDSSDKQEFREFYDLIAEKRRLRNRMLEQDKMTEENVYKDAQFFFEKCKEREEYYLKNNSFMEYIDQKKLMELVEKSKVGEIYTIVEAFKKVYHMGNLNDFYSTDLRLLKELENLLSEYNNTNEKGITNRLAVETFIEEIHSAIVKLEA